MKLAHIIIAILISTVFCIRVSPKVKEELNKGEVDVFVNLKNQADFKSVKTDFDLMEESTRGKLVVNLLKEQTQTQQPILEFLNQQYKSLQTHSFYITNTISIKNINSQIIQQLEEKFNHLIESIEYIDTIQITEKPTPVSTPLKNRVEAGVAWVKAPELWRRGVTGRGILIGVIDTGAFLHDDLKNQYRGRNGDHKSSWLDTVAGRPEPYDDNFHGTHCHGTVTAKSDVQTVGVATDAEWVSCKFLSASGSGTYDNCLKCMEFMLAPNGDSDKRPHVVSNSYGGGSYTAAIDRALTALLNAGVEMVYAAGNSAVCNGVGQPAILPQALSVGALQRSSDSIAFFSSGGPGNDNQLKPEVSAPGAGVISTSNRGGYVSSDGTSMACPHVAGVIALLWSGRASLKRKIKETRDVIYRTSKGQVPYLWQYRCSSQQPSPNNVYGYGTVDVARAYEISATDNKFIFTK